MLCYVYVLLVVTRDIMVAICAEVDMGAVPDKMKIKDDVTELLWSLFIRHISMIASILFLSPFLASSKSAYYMRELCIPDTREM